MDESKLHALYPDIAKYGSLGKLLNAELRRNGSVINVVRFEESINGSKYWASVKNDYRSCDISCAIKIRAFMAPLWLNGVLLVTVKTTSIYHLTTILNDWFSKEYSPTELKKRYSDIELSDTAEYYEKGSQEFVNYHWKTLLQYIAVDFSVLVPVIQEACNSKIIRILYPFTSHDNLCFSRCTGYPYTDDCPYIVPLYGELYIYQVLSPKGKLLGEGGPHEAIDIVIKNLPVSCGPAIHGTDKDINIARLGA